MAGARALWVANGMKREQFGKPIIAIVNSFTQFVPGHTHLHEAGQIVKKEIEKMGCYAAEFDTIAIDDGIAMGHDGMLYSLPSRDIIADSVEYMVNGHKADAMICISNCDKITPGMLMAAMRLNIPAVFVSGGPMEAGQYKGENLDLVIAMIKGGDPTVSDADLQEIENRACPGCGCCSGMFTANSMNNLTEAIGLSLPGNGTILATHKNRERLMKQAARLIVKNALAYYEDGDESVLPRSIATRQAFLNAMTMDIAMGASTNTVLHLLAVAQEAGVDFTMNDIDALSRKTPFLVKLAPNSQKYSVQEFGRAGGVMGLMAELAGGGREENLRGGQVSVLVSRFSPGNGQFGVSLVHAVCLNILFQRMTVHTLQAGINQSALVQFGHQSHHAAGSAKLLHAVLLTVGSQLHQEGRLAREGVYVVHREVHPSLLCHGQQVQDRVGRGTHGYIHCHGVQESLAGGNAAWQHALVAILVVGHCVLHNQPGRLSHQSLTVLMRGQYGAVAGQRQANGLRQVVHRVGGEHSHVG